MRACAQVALVLLTVSASLGLAGCASIDGLKDTMSGWFASGKFVGGHEGDISRDVPDATPRIAPDKTQSEEESKASKKKEKPAHKLQRQETVELPRKPPLSASAEAVRPQGADAQSAPSQAAPSGLGTPWPEAPASGTFSDRYPSP
jgi:hypothetical protein